VFGIFDGIETDDLPWAVPKKASVFGKDGKSGALSVPKEGAPVSVRFNQDVYSIEYESILELSDDVKSELNDDYEGTHILLFDGDEDFKMWFTTNKGFTINYQGSRINIDPENRITIEHADTESIIELDGNTITINSDSEVNTNAPSRIKSSSNEVWADGKTTKLGHVPQFSGVLGEPLFSLLTVIAQAVDQKFPPTPGTVSSAVEQMRKQTLSNSVKTSK
jgi:RNase P/RNase MRP subunit p29